MSRRWQPWAMPAASAILVVAGEAAAVATEGNENVSVSGAISFMIPIVAFSVVGGLISSRRPGDLIGRLLAVIGLLFSFVIAFSSISGWGLETGRLPRDLAEWMIVPANAWVVALGLTGTQLLIRLPDGRLPSRRWTWFSRVTIALIAIAVVGMATQRGPVMDVAGTANPIGSAWAEQLAPAFLLVILSFFGGIAGLVMRYRRSTGHDRAQLRWVALGGTAFVVIYVVTLLLGNLFAEHSIIGDAITAFSQAAFAALPIGIGFAILRQRLYDIDVVINRALVYGGLTTLLAGTYLGSVLLLQLLLDRFTQGSGLAVAASTLATAAIVRPARARIQDAVDHRFFRRKYDAAQTLERFGARLRDEVDLDSLTDELRGVVAETMQPAHVTLWVRPTEPVR
jgi:hypothetical protein